VRASARRFRIVIASVFALGVWASHAFGAVQDIRADKEAGIGSVATVIGAKPTVVLALVMYLAAGLLALFLEGRYAQVAIAAIPYLIVVGRELSITNENCERANRGWKWFIYLNFGSGSST